MVPDLNLPKDLSFLALSNRSFHEIFHPWIYENEIDGNRGHRVLVFAAQMRHISTIRLLLRLNADRVIRGKTKFDPNGRTGGYGYRFSA